MQTNFIHNTIQSIEILPFSVAGIIFFAFGLFFTWLMIFISGAEVAYFSLSAEALDELEAGTSEREKKAAKLANNPQKLLGTVMISNTLIKVAVIILLSAFINSVFNFEYVPWTGFFIQLVFFTIYMILFGETIPKVYSSQFPKKAALRSANILFGLQQTFLPLVNLLVNSNALINSKILKNLNTNISMDELVIAREMANSYENPVEENKMLEGIINFGNINVADVMTPRVDIEDIDIKNNFDQVKSKIIKSGYSRIPVYAGTRDNIRGILFSKDLLPFLDKPSSFRWQTLIRQPFYVPETKKIDNLLSEFQENHVHIALVVDEYGGTSGLVTMEDIMEEIVGDINDEYDEDETLYTKIDNHTFVFEAKILLNDFFKIAEIEEADFSKITDEVETLAGLILELKGEIPQKNEQIDYGRYIFEILSVDNRRIRKVKLHIRNAKEDARENEKE